MERPCSCLVRSTLRQSSLIGKAPEVGSVIKADEIIDLDANATTCLDHRVLQRLVVALSCSWANPSSDHLLGRAARDAVESARSSVARLIGAESKDIIFASSATEAVNVAIQGVVRARPHRPVHVVASVIEHKAILETVSYLRERGDAEVTLVRPDRYGTLAPSDIIDAVREDTCLICVGHANSEVGTVNAVEEIGRGLAQLRARPALFVDASQTGAFWPPNVSRANIDLLCLSSHKMHGPKGAAALYVQEGTELAPVIFGGGQERGFRPGTLNVPALMGFGLAADLALTEGSARANTVRMMRDRFLGGLQEYVPDLWLNGHPVHRLPGNLSLTFPHVDARMLQKRVPHLAFSRGSACTSEGGESHVLRGIGLPKKARLWTIRIGLSHMTPLEKIEQAVADLGRAVEALRGGLGPG